MRAREARRARFRFTPRLALVAAALAVPAAYATSSYVGEQNAPIAFGAAERVGVVAVAPASRVVADLVDLRTAEDVRKLAEESQQAAATISQLIGEIQSRTGQAVDIVSEGARRTAQGVAVVQQTREAFEQIGVQVAEVTRQVAQIVTATAEVAAVAEGSSAAAEQVSASTEQTSASAHEIASSAQALASTAGQLEQLVARFQLAQTISGSRRGHVRWGRVSGTCPKWTAPVPGTGFSALLRHPKSLHVARFRPVPGTGSKP